MNKIKHYIAEHKVEIFVTAGAITIFVVGVAVGYNSGRSLSKAIESSMLEAIVETIKKDGAACLGLTLDTGEQLLAKFVFG